MCHECKGPAICHITLNLIKLKDLQATQLIQRILSFASQKNKKNLIISLVKSLGKDENELYTRRYKIT